MPDELMEHLERHFGEMSRNLLEMQNYLRGLPDWIIEATALLYVKEQGGDKTAMECKEKLRQAIHEHYDKAVSEAKKQNAELAEDVADDLSFGLLMLSEGHTYADYDSANFGTQPKKLAEEFLKPYTVLCAAHAVLLVNAGDILKQWYEEAPRQGTDGAQAARALTYNFLTGQEIDLLERSACDGRTGMGWRNELQRGARVYEPQGVSHRVELLQAADGEEIEVLSLDALEELTHSQDADFAYTLIYVASTLAPPAPLPSNLFAGGWIDLDDVMEQIGWYPSKLSLQRRSELRAKVWRYLAYGNRAFVFGERTTTYYDKATGKNISTRIASPVWRIMSVESPVQRALFGEVPCRVQIAISKQWEPLLTSARLAQYLPLAELVGAIPPNKVAGDWARSIALVLARLWRMFPRETHAGTIRPTHRELLTHYTPKTKTVQELLGSNKPKRAVQYWRDALAMLADSGLIAREGEAARTVAEMLKAHPGYGWQDAWLDETVDIRPGDKMASHVQERAEALPLAKPKALEAPKKRRGRPPKKHD